MIYAKVFALWNMNLSNPSVAAVWKMKPTHTLVTKLSTMGSVSTPHFRDMMARSDKSIAELNRALWQHMDMASNRADKHMEMASNRADKQLTWMIGGFGAMLGGFVVLGQKIDTVFDKLDAKYSELKTDYSELKTDIQELNSELKTDIQELKSLMVETNKKKWFFL
jgi:hypothetical protein